MEDNKIKESLALRVKEAQLFTNRFASFSKADYEVLMFTAYLDCLDEDNMTDYDISIKLGIPESKVRNLRVKSQLQYPREIHWEEKLTKAIQHGVYDQVQKQLTITIEDPSVRNRIRHEVESKYGIVNISLNSKQLVLPIESFLILAACAEGDTEGILRKLRDELNNNKINYIEKGSLKDRFLKQVEDIGGLLNNLATIYTVGKPIIAAVIGLIS